MFELRWALSFLILSLLQDLTVQEGRGEVLVYNRVWRTGSTGLLTLLEQLSSRNNFWMIAATEATWDSVLYRKTPNMIQDEGLNASASAHIIGTFLRGAVADAFRQRGPNSVGLIHGHLTIDATRYIEDVAKVRRINIVREPKSRALSEYAYLQAGPKARLTKDYGYEQNRSIASLIDCLDSSSCRSWLARICRHQTDTVCGTDDMNLCLSSHEKQRLRWLWSNYDFIGTTAQLKHSLAYLERLLPAWFTGASQLYRDDERPNAVSREELHSNFSSRLTFFLEAACAVDTELYQSIQTAFSTNSGSSSICKPCVLPVTINNTTRQLQVHCDKSLWSDQVDLFITAHGLSGGSGFCDAVCVRKLILGELHTVCASTSY